LFFAAIFGYKKICLYTWSIVSSGITFWAYLKYFPKEKEEEALYSREFWIFLGSIILMLSSLIITYFTSLPVINKLFGSNYAQLKVHEYNDFILPFGIALLLLIGAAQLLKYKKNSAADFFKKLTTAFILALVFGVTASLPLYFFSDQHFSTYNQIGFTILLISGLFAVFGNLDYMLRVLKGKVKKSGASIAHIGFALIMIGALISTSKKQILSKNTSKQNVSDLGKDFDNQKSILLSKGDTLPMGPYLVTYKGKERKGIDIYFKVDYLKAGKDGKPEYDFTLTPKVQDNPRMGKAAEPATRHYAGRDIYTHVTYADLETEIDSTTAGKFNEPKNYIGHLKDTIFATNAIIVIDSLLTNLNEKEYRQNDSLLIVTAVLTAFDVQGRIYKAKPKYIIKNNIAIPSEDIIEALGLKFVFWKINPEEGSVEITMSERISNSKDFIVMEAYMFPFINVLWLGCIIMALGTGIAIAERIRQLKSAHV